MIVKNIFNSTFLKYAASDILNRSFDTIKDVKYVVNNNVIKFHIILNNNDVVEFQCFITVVANLKSRYEDYYLKENIRIFLND